MSVCFCVCVHGCIILVVQLGVYILLVWASGNIHLLGGLCVCMPVLGMCVCVVISYVCLCVHVHGVYMFGVVVIWLGMVYKHGVAHGPCHHKV